MARSVSWVCEMRTALNQSLRSSDCTNKMPPSPRKLNGSPIFKILEHRGPKFDAPLQGKCSCLLLAAGAGSNSKGTSRNLDLTGQLHRHAVHVGLVVTNTLPAKDKVRAVKIIERDDDAEGGGEWSGSARTSVFWCCWEPNQPVKFNELVSRPVHRESRIRSAEEDLVSYVFERLF